MKKTQNFSIGEDDKMNSFQYEDEVLDQNDQPLNMRDTVNLYVGKEIVIGNLTYTCIDKIHYKNHLDLKSDFFVPVGLWVVQGHHNGYYYEFYKNSLKKTSLYIFYNGIRYDNNTSIDEWLDQCGVVRHMNDSSPYVYFN